MASGGGCVGDEDIYHRYTEKLLRKYWKEACDKAGEDIDVYRGTKTSRASQMVNELGMNLHDLQVAGDWASFESVKSYARANIAKKRELINKVVRLKEKKDVRASGD